MRASRLSLSHNLRSWVDRLERGAIDPSELVITNRVSKKREEYTQSTRSVAALERAADLGLMRAPGQSVSYVVEDDAKQSRERVMLASEELDEYDTRFYRELLVRAAVSVLSPLEWREKRNKKWSSTRSVGDWTCLARPLIETFLSALEAPEVVVYHERGYLRTRLYHLSGITTQSKPRFESPCD